jgi:hypothetical protein
MKESKIIVARLFHLSFAFLIALATGMLLPIWADAFSTGMRAPEISGGPWINSQPLTLANLKGSVVLVEFWTYG